jgi:hypothetical protein
MIFEHEEQPNYLSIEHHLFAKEWQGFPLQEFSNSHG